MSIQAFGKRWQETILDSEDLNQQMLQKKVVQEESFVDGV